MDPSIWVIDLNLQPSMNTPFTQAQTVLSWCHKPQSFWGPNVEKLQDVWASSAPASACVAMHWLSRSHFQATPHSLHGNSMIWWPNLEPLRLESQPSQTWQYFSAFAAIEIRKLEVSLRQMTLNQKLWYLFGDAYDAYPAILVLFKGFWDVDLSTAVLTQSQMTILAVDTHPNDILA